MRVFDDFHSEISTTALNVASQLSDFCFTGFDLREASEATKELQEATRERQAAYGEKSFFTKIVQTC